METSQAVCPLRQAVYPHAALAAVSFPGLPALALGSPQSAHPVTRMSHRLEDETPVEHLLNACQLVGALRSHVDAGGQELLEAIGRRVWCAVLQLEPQRRKLLERHGGVGQGMAG